MPPRKDPHEPDAAAAPSPRAADAQPTPTPTPEPARSQPPEPERRRERDREAAPTDDEVRERSSAERAAEASDRADPVEREDSADATRLAHQAAEAAGTPGDQGADMAGQARVIHERQALEHGARSSESGERRGRPQQGPEEYTVLNAMLRGDPETAEVTTLLPGDPVSFQPHEYAHVQDLLAAKTIAEGTGEEAEAALGRADLARGQALRATFPG